ncbi:MAG TPA: acetyl-CoA carboxylase biotin carboxyl carrier protein [Rhizomicrobium sp.]|nr:acetyl-CoA carboxylase biotin carboxyl carrier protein [Rhizomicrobium sp.]
MKDVKQLGARFAGNAKEKIQLQVDAPAIRELAELLEETGLGEIEIEQGGRRIRVSRASHTEALPPSTPVPVMSERVGVPDGPAEQPVRKPDTDGAVLSPLVGTVYIAPEPGKPSFVKIGDSVRAGDTLLIVEAMKTMNPIVAPQAGTVKEICVSDAQPVEFGQTLMVLSSG